MVSRPLHNQTSRTHVPAPSRCTQKRYIALSHLVMDIDRLLRFLAPRCRPDGADYAVFSETREPTCDALGGNCARRSRGESRGGGAAVPRSERQAHSRKRKGLREAGGPRKGQVARCCIRGCRRRCQSQADAPVSFHQLNLLEPGTAGVSKARSLSVQLFPSVWYSLVFGRHQVSGPMACPPQGSVGCCDTSFC